MISTVEFINHLESLVLLKGDTLVIRQVDFDPLTFIELINDTKFRIVSNSEGKVSQVEQGDDSRDLSRSVGNFDYHSDGLYHPIIPQFGLLFCKKQGARKATTRFSDSLSALNSLKHNESIEVLRKLDTVYINKSGIQYSQPLVQKHPLTGDEILVLGSRAFLRPRYKNAAVSGLPTLRDISFVSNMLYEAIDSSFTHEQRWKDGDLIIFDNYRFLHCRHSPEPDFNRQLLRIWLNIK
jgi:alpha-ketoglutarate-dependent taurine dioxygenase